ncbi:MAG: aminotransferase class V-fold PLP-dependent enzyme, partial [Flavobacteriales bacterium]|nr:aminotransferase class V-fold PLP-dependent enzyme [Flavobacteriales bacterium]
MESHREHISGLKNYMKEQLLSELEGVTFNGDTDEETSLYTVLNTSFPSSGTSEMMLFNLDIAGIASSGGSACTSGTDQGSHVLRGIGSDPERPAVRFSFSRYNTREEVDYVIDTLKGLLNK